MTDISGLQALIDDFSYLDSWEDRYAHIIAMGKAMPKLDDAYKIDENIVQGCMSKVWLTQDQNALPDLRFMAESDAFIVQGLIAIVMTLIDGLNAKDIADYNFQQAFDQLSLSQHLSQQRNNGLGALTQHIQAMANLHTSTYP